MVVHLMGLRCMSALLFLLMRRLVAGGAGGDPLRGGEQRQFLRAPPDELHPDWQAVRRLADRDGHNRMAAHVKDDGVQQICRELWHLPAVDRNRYIAGAVGESRAWKDGADPDVVLVQEAL